MDTDTVFVITIKSVYYMLYSELFDSTSNFVFYNFLPHRKVPGEVAESQSSIGFVLDDRTVLEAMMWPTIEIGDWTWLTK